MFKTKIANSFNIDLFKLRSYKLSKIISLAFVFTSLFVLVIVVQQRQEIRKKAQELQQETLDTNNEILISSNQIAIKIKKESKDKIKSGNPDDTGTLSLNKTFKNYKVKKFEKVFKQDKNQESSDLDLWYEIELDIENKKVKANDKEGENIKKIISEISANENVDKAEPNYIYKLFQTATPNPTPIPNTTRIISPVGGETWYRGETHTISWVKGNNENPSSASLHCYTNDNFGNPINVGAIDYNLPTNSANPSAPNTYSWTIPTSGQASCPPDNPESRIGVVLWDANGNMVSSAISDILTITQAPTPTPDVARILSPSGGETWRRGETHTISWIRGSGNTNASSASLFCYTTDANGNPQYVGAIEYNLPTSSTNPSTPNTYSWQIPTSGAFSCPSSNPPTIIEMGLFDTGGNNIATARSGVLTIYPQSYTLTPTPSFLVPNDPYYFSSNSWGQGYEDMWGLKKIDTSHSWYKTTGSKDIVVAVIDTGMDYNHEDLGGVVWVNSDEISGNGIDDDHNGYIDDVNGWDYATLHWPNFGDNDPMDDNGHGTHVSGTIGAVGNNGKGIVGINWKVTIMPIKVLDDGGFGYSMRIAQALKYAADNGAKISSNSYGGLERSFLIDDALKYEYDKGMIIIAAAGNSKDDALNYQPANSDYVITVGASDANDSLASFSNYGEKIDVVAPGKDILSTKSSQNNICYDAITVGSNYCRLNGTSMSTPHVTGLAALILAFNPNLNNEEVRQIIRQGADDLGSTGKDFNFGYGRINATKSINLSSERPLTPVITYPKSRSEVTGQRTLVIKGGITGSNFKSYKIEYAKYDYRLIPQQGGWLKPDFRRPSNWQTFGPYTTLPTDGNLLSFDLTQRESGFYSFRLIATDNQGRNYYYQVNDIRIDKEQVSGWPKDFYCPSWNGCQNISPAISDINNDGQKEIVIMESVYNNENLPNAIKLHVFKKNGTYLTGFPVSFNVETDYVHYPSPLADANNPVSIDDIDNDGKKEIILTVLNSGYYREFIYVIRSDGKIKSGWPKLFEGVSPTHGQGHIPVISDLDKDGKKEIVLIDGSNKLQALKPDGSNLAGFPKTPLPSNLDPGEFTSANFYVGQLSIFDMDNDGKQEIAVGRPSYMYLLDNQGNILPGWPYKAPFINNYPVNFYSTPSFGDLDGDGKAELIAVATYRNNYGLGCVKYPVTCQSQIYVWKKDGTLIPGWPRNEGLIYDSPNVYGPSLANMDGDEKDEIVTGLGKLSIYDLEGKKSFNPEPVTNFQPSLSDIDGDGKLEMTAGTMWSNIFSIIKQDGSNYWKTSLFNVPLGGGVIADMDNNGFMELSLASAEGEFYNFSSKFRVYLWEIPNLISTNSPRFEWNMFGRDPSLSGRVPKYPNVLKSTASKSSIWPISYTVRFSWDSVAPKNSSLYIFQGSCKSGTYGPGDLLWSQPTGVNTSYVYTPIRARVGNVYCGQIWIDFNKNIPASNASSVTIQ
ncbi:MAG: Cell wall/surface repeat protein [Candidatus Woesebacteria bacterium GW2011_GWB1_39_12]|uniref:Cell wall/surface repeat protein n=2 Tax=Candidatus Woeseibacteriota TaxID=1752722 RepID=A0A0G0PH08_9BACT|nr:MAG: Cell wall/surface repeat protein [Candidatus Woesebacteria bacterium GW2011_GWA1_39_12]KKR00961.1 MAG: Cell wall/surface repeat protein [Candidatus Woesebacteria bacterium GW2011_GWB1_39_12]